jgi:hypothetical protein
MLSKKRTFKIQGVEPLPLSPRRFDELLFHRQKIFRIHLSLPSRRIPLFLPEIAGKVELVASPKKGNISIYLFIKVMEQ